MPGGRLLGYDESTIAKMPGVHKIVKVDETAVAVIAASWWQAHRAVTELPVTWDRGPHAHVNTASIDALLEDGLAASKAFAGNASGDAATAIGGAARTVTADYSFPYQAHAAMEPLNATVLYTPRSCVAWVPTQNAGACLETLADISGLPIENCDVHRMHLGGGFGRRLYHDYVRQAVLIAKQLPDTSVKLVWSREEDMTHDLYHPTTRCRLTGALDTQGRLTGLHMRISGQSIRATHAPHRVIDGADPHMFHGLAEEAFPYDVPNLLIDYAMRNPPLTPGSWRGVHINQNFIYLESFIDELAVAAGKDPLAFRLELLKSKPKQRAVLEAVAARIDWSAAPPAGRHRGLAVGYGYGSYVAAAAEVSVETGTLKIHRLIGAIDPGHAVNPALIERQAEGCYAFALSASLYGACTVSDGEVEQRNFDGYEVLRMEAMPASETIVMPSGDFWGGCGEPLMAVVAPSVLNAIAKATGRRVRHLPIRTSGIVKV